MVKKKFGFQLARLASAPPQGDDWIYEIKFDGYRIQARISNGRFSLITRNDQDYTHRFSSLLRDLKKIKAASTVLDGEVVMADANGRFSFQILQNSLEANDTKSVSYRVFDILELNGKDLRPLFLLERRKILKDLLARQKLKNVFFSDAIEGKAEDLLARACNLDWEGIIAKRKSEPYKERRTDDWLKLKCHKRQELVIGGYTSSTNASYPFGALLIGYFDQGKLHYAGKVGTGFTSASRKELKKRFAKERSTTNPFVNKVPSPEKKSATWLKPVLVCEIEFTEWTGDNRLRHPSFQGLREDKKARTVGREKPSHK